MERPRSTFTCLACGMMMASTAKGTHMRACSRTTRLQGAASFSAPTYMGITNGHVLSSCLQETHTLLAEVASGLQHNFPNLAAHLMVNGGSDGCEQTVAPTAPLGLGVTATTPGQGISNFQVPPLYIPTTPAAQFPTSGVAAHNSQTVGSQPTPPPSSPPHTMPVKVVGNV
ncbi:hypothetical protein Vretimale_10557 [Volvox reticuliferus]|uniref:Uncharacterized protein n=1 Tax=Volvox reticuliferus TaxID=1737510 RepID=A0A8J4LRD7_9CHLO|nr:hypothetical protein Vretimale_10557 [Volvox reticuliferus]